MNIRDLPEHIQTLIHQRQIDQGNDGTFDGDIGEFKENGNFNWYVTPEYDSLWWALSKSEPVKDVQYYIDIKNQLHINCTEEKYCAACKNKFNV